ncbi:Peptidase M20 [Penicillium coprophilum]|uniref:Peptidase M20 n=1 Tax=Penicillium coprophilum TaxID=36646 RepID=UPI0023A11D35|nr:Peptidase M20 [Penicillium coprophilum]XP_056536023.1 Peptidase M20 [Penicillium coprophilum]KAJ5150783.1 Peptidase M20 [Penicillium coprophilum]KAJ5171569.1 Peptidase M20 [Penicillium coprophilum]
MRANYFSAVAFLARVTLASESQQLLGGKVVHENVKSPSEELSKIIDESPFLSFHRDIVQIPSISEHERSVGNFLLDFIRSHNLTVEKQIITPESDTEQERFNIYAYTGENRFPSVLLTSHIDTVPPFIPYSLHPPALNNTENWTFNRSDLVIAGRGTVDAKASVAAILFAALETLEGNPDASIGLLFDVGEEKSGVGMKHFSNSDLNPVPPTFHTVIFGEPTELKLVAGHKGTLGFKIVANGKPAHSGYPWLGKSAISSLLPVLSYLDSLQDIPPEKGGLLRSEKFGQSTLNIGVVRAGLAANVIPAYAEATVSVRLAAGSPDETREIVRKAVEEVKGGDGSVYLDFGNTENGAPPQHLDVDVDGFDVTTVNYGTDIPSLKINTQGGPKVKRYLYGPGSIHVAHGDDEAITVGELEEAVRGYKRLISAALDTH